MKFGETLIQHEARALMTRGVEGLYIYARNPELRNILLAAAKGDKFDTGDNKTDTAVSR